MGIGEPLDKYDNTVKFLRLVNHTDGLNIGYRHISLSSCGIADKISRLADENLPITLSISLHAANDSLRTSIMPVNKRWDIDTLLTACAEYYKKTRRRISFEYTLIVGKNDSADDAKALAALLKKYFTPLKAPIHVNLIPLNPVTNRQGKGDIGSAENFAALLEKLEITATVRRRLGSDIDAACGQLRRKAQNKA